MSNNISGKKDILIDEIKRELGKLELSGLKTNNIFKSIFNSDNTKTENKIITNKSELISLFNDLQSFDKSKDGIIDQNEVSNFIENYNKNNPDKQIKTADLFEFIHNVENFINKSKQAIIFKNKDLNVEKKDDTNIATIEISKPNIKDIFTTEEEYKDQDVIKTMEDFQAFFNISLNKAIETLEFYHKQYGFSEKAADAISKLWNNDFIETTGNTYEILTRKLEHAKYTLELMSKADNSIEGITKEKDFRKYYKELTGVSFNPKLLKEFLDFRPKYFEHKSTIIAYQHVKNNFEEALQDFSNIYEKRKKIKNTIVSSKARSAKYIIDKNHYKKAYDRLYTLYNEIIGVKREDWDKMFEIFRKQNINPIPILKSQMSIISSIVEDNAKEILGEKNIKNIEKYTKDLDKKYKQLSKQALGSQVNVMKPVLAYNTSQILGGIATRAIGQMLLYSTGLSVLGATALMSKGAISGISYSASYLLVDVTDRLTNEIDNKEDLYNKDCLINISTNCVTEYIAGYAFDGILKSKIFSKIDDKSINKEKIAKKFLDSSGKNFTKEAFKKFLIARSIAGAGGGIKDGTKEFVKEICKRDANGKDIISATLIGAISNALFIKFKNSDFAKIDHKIMGKLIEKSPKTTSKEELKNKQDSPQNVSIQSLILEFKSEVIKELRDIASKNEIIADEINSFLEYNSDQLDEIIAKFLIIEYILDENNNDDE